MKSEHAQAERAAELVEAILEGTRPAAPAPPAQEDQRVLEAVQLLREDGPALAPARRDALIDEAFAAVRTGRAPSPVTRRGLPPYVLAAAVLAALALLWVRRPMPPPLRSPDAVVGRITASQAGDASRRIDLLYADRLTASRREGP